MKEPIHRYLDAAILKPEFSAKEAEAAIKECIKHSTRTVCVRPCDINLAVKLCRGTNTEVSCVLAFPHGTSTVETKVFEAKQYVDMGVQEIDMVINYGKIKSGDWQYVEDEVKTIVNTVKKYEVLLKVIFETCFLTKEEIEAATKVCINAGADYIKTSTGFGSSGASVEAVKTMLSSAEGKIKVKASGGIRDKKTALNYIEMGVERLGVNFSAIEAICTEGLVAKEEGY